MGTRVKFSAPNEALSYETVTDLKWVLEQFPKDVPHVKHHRAIFLDTIAMCVDPLLDQYSKKTPFSTRTKHLVHQVGLCLDTYGSRFRHKIGKKHRDTLWALRCRFHVLDSLLPQTPINWPYLRSRDALVSMTSVETFSLRTLWHAVTSLVARLATLCPYNKEGKELTLYVEHLAQRTAVLVSFAGSYSTINHPALSTLIPETTYRTVNRNFLRESERCFFWIQRALSTFYSFKRIRKRRRRESENAEEEKEIYQAPSSLCDSIQKWLEREVKLSSSYAEFIQEEFRGSAMQYHLRVTERERFEESNKFQEVNARNILNKFRTLEFARIEETIRETPLLEMVQQKKTNEHTSPLLELENKLNRIHIFTLAIRYHLRARCPEIASTRFIVRWFQVPPKHKAMFRMVIWEKDDGAFRNMPRIVETFPGTWGVMIEDGTLCDCKDFDSAVVYWMDRIQHCENVPLGMKDVLLSISNPQKNTNMEIEEDIDETDEKENSSLVFVSI